MATEQPLQVSEIYNRLWGYEKPNLEPVLNNINVNCEYSIKRTVKNGKQENLKHKVKVMMIDGTEVNITYNQPAPIHYIESYLNDKLQNNYIYKFYKKGEEDELDKFDYIKLHQMGEPDILFAMATQPRDFEIGMTYEKFGYRYHYEERMEDRTVKFVYTIIKRTKSFIEYNKKMYRLINNEWEYDDLISNVKCKVKDDDDKGEIICKKGVGVPRKSIDWN